MGIEQDFQHLKTYIATETKEVEENAYIESEEINAWQANIRPRILTFYFKHENDPQVKRYQERIGSFFSSRHRRLEDKLKKQGELLAQAEYSEGQ